MILFKQIKTMTYIEALAEGMSNREFVSNYDRIMGAHLSGCLHHMSKGDIAHEIDKATGFLHAEIAKFDAFFYEYVWSRLPQGSFE